MEAAFTARKKQDDRSAHWYEAAGIGRKEFKIKHVL